MVKEIQQILRLLMAQVRRERRHISKHMEGGLLVTVSAETGISSPDHLNCTVAAAGYWCSGITMAEMKEEVVRRLPSSATLSCPADPEVVSTFTETCGALCFLVSFQVGEGRHAVKESFSRMEQFLHRLSLVHGQVEIHFVLKVNENMSQQIFSSRENTTFALDGGRVLADSTHALRWPLAEGPGPQCRRFHPVLGAAVPLLLPSDVAETGLCGETSLLPLAALSPCVEQYPNRPAHLTEIHILLYGPSNVPLVCPIEFLCQLASALTWKQFGLSGVRCSERLSSVGEMCSEMVYIVEREHRQITETEQTLITEQTLVLLLFIQHNDPFHSQLADYMASEEILEQHLDQILLYNKELLKSALHSVVESTLKGLMKRLKVRERIVSSLPVILSSLSTVVTSSSSLEFRTACVDRMKALDTHELTSRLHQSLQKVTADRFLPSRKCDNSKWYLSPALEAENISACMRSKTRKEEGICKALRKPAGQMSYPTKRPWADKQDSNLVPMKQEPRGSPMRTLHHLQPSLSLKSSPVYTVPHHGKENDQPCQEDMLWLQEISNMSDWEEDSGDTASIWTASHGCKDYVVDGETALSNGEDSLHSLH